ncbi:hypothetical protein LTR08_005917 [Meristemomyces frigidus]|nr:hypothetical protein LTR08_005917 [Meristemomyces frigidus]
MDNKADVKRRDSSHPSPGAQSMEGAQQQYHYRSSSGQLARPAGNGHNLLPPILLSNMTAQPVYPPAHPPHYVPTNQYTHYQNGAMQPAPMPSNVGVNGQSGVLRFPIPPQATQESRHMNGSQRHKKEIKRRTKTGCLTCRKRRIKVRVNAIVTKPNLTAETQNGPANLAAKPDTSSISPDRTPTLPSIPYQPPQSYLGTGGAFVSYGASLDPALSSSDRDQPRAMAPNTYKPSIPPLRKVVPLTMDDLFSLDDVSPQYQKREAPAPISPATQREIADFYTFHFAPGLDRVLETDYYTVHGLSHLQLDAALEDFVSQCLDQFRVRPDDAKASSQIRSLEARLVWHLAVMPRSSSSHLDLVARIDTLEALLTGQFIDASSVPSFPQHTTEQPKYNEQAFWHNLGRFVSIHDERPDPSATKQVNDVLGAMRGILGMLENRDVLYSMAVARHIGGRMPEFHPHRHLVASTNDPNDELNKLKVAHQFVESENQRGTTEVIQRFCGMALRSWALQKQ